MYIAIDTEGSLAPYRNERKYYKEVKLEVVVAYFFEYDEYLVFTDYDFKGASNVKVLPLRRMSYFIDSAYTNGFNIVGWSLYHDLHMIREYIYSHRSVLKGTYKLRAVDMRRVIREITGHDLRLWQIGLAMYNTRTKARGKTPLEKIKKCIKDVYITSMLYSDALSGVNLEYYDPYIKGVRTAGRVLIDIDDVDYEVIIGD